MAYTVDLIRVLQSLFDFAIAPKLLGRTTWPVLQEAFEAYERSDSRQQIHRQICANFQQDRQIHNLNGFDRGWVSVLPVRLETKREVRAPDSEILECARQLERWRHYSHLLPDAAHRLPPSCHTPLSTLDAPWLVRYRFFGFEMSLLSSFIHCLIA